MRRSVLAAPLDRGVIIAQGGKFGGWALYMDRGKPTYTYNWFGLDAYTVQAARSVQGVLRRGFAVLHRVLRPRRLAIVVRAGDEVLGEGRASQPEPGDLLTEWMSVGARRGIVAARGSTDQVAGFAGTTSVCPISINDGAPGSVPGTR